MGNKYFTILHEKKHGDAWVRGVPVSGHRRKYTGTGVMKKDTVVDKQKTT